MSTSSFQDLKTDIKCWERMFERQHKRKPGKSDVKNAPPEIQQCYKDYMVLKKEAAKSEIGKDVFGSDLNKPLDTKSEEQDTRLTLVTPNLRKKFDIKKSRYNQSTKEKDEEPRPESFGLDASLLVDEPSPAVPKNTSFFSKNSTSILNKLEKSNSEGQSFHETRLNKPADSHDIVTGENDSNQQNVVKKQVPADGSFDVFDLSENNQNLSNISEVTKQDLASHKSGEDESPGLYSFGKESLQINDDLLNQDQVRKKRKVEVEAAEVDSCSDNFVRLNMKSKKYRRPGQAMTGEAYKRKQWKSRGLFGKGPPKDWKNPNKKPPPPKWATGEKSKPGKCFKCGEEGHWANKCPGKQPAVTKEVTPEEKAEREELDFSSLEPMLRVGEGAGFQTDNDPVITTNASPCAPLLDGTEDEEYVEELLKEGLQELGYLSFRSGQRAAVLRILRGKSTLLVLSTGSGKSLVYQLAAYLYYKKLGVLTLVISPLISLMDDQIQSLPAKLPGRAVHSHLSAKQKQTLKADISNGRVPLLLLSPEALTAGSYGSLPREMPPIGFVCIDEAHCLSSWSDNFRPAYLRVCDMLRLKYNVQCFLGLTATCTTASCQNVCRFIGVEEEEGILKGPVIRDNLYVTVSSDQDRDRALTSILGGERFKDLGSIIIYCTRRQQCERVATLLRTTLPQWAPEDDDLCLDKKKGKRKRKALENSTAESYHAGLTPSQRSRVQYHFMAGTLRIVCATVAFGMGLDKANVRSVIHYSMPKSFENYVQEIGRAGRDGRDAHCHIFVDDTGADLAELSKHAHSNTVDRYSVQVLLKHIFKPCACNTLSKLQQSEETKETKEAPPQVDTKDMDEDDKLLEEDDMDIVEVEKSVKRSIRCPGHSVTFPIAKLVADVDVPEENIATMLTYLELSSSRSWIKLKQPVNATCYIQAYGGPAHLTAVAKQATTVLAAMKFYSDPEAAANELEFPYIELAAKMGWDPYIVRRELRDLSKRSIPGFKLGVLVEFKDLSFHVHAPGNLLDEEMDEVTDYLYKRVMAQKNSEIRRLKDLHRSLLEVSASTHYDAAHEVNHEKDKQLKDKILHYFTESSEEVEGDWQFLAPDLPPAHILSNVLRDIRTFIQKHHELPLRGRVVARIFQGISSPNYPAMTWGRVRQFWRRHIDVDFDWMVRCATQEIASLGLST